MNYQKEAKEKLYSIEADIFKMIPDINSMSLMQGIGGLPVLYIQLYKNTRSRHYLNKIDLIIDLLIDLLQSNKASMSFCEGIAGVSFMLNYLQKHTRHNQSSFLEINNILDRLMLSYSRKHNSAYNLDFMHGSAGILVSWLNKKGSTGTIYQETQYLMTRYVQAIENYLQGLNDEANSKKIVNCGMAHGIISQIMVLSLYTSRFKDLRYTATLQKLINLVASVQDDPDDFSLSLFPAIRNLNDAMPKSGYRVPLGWCYGDTVVSIGLAKAGEVLNSSLIVKKAHDLAYRTTFRLTNKQAAVYDASFCHGSSSIAHTYNKWKWKSGDASFTSAYESWINRTIELSQFPDGIGGYKKFEGEKYTREAGILDGAAGVALVLSDYVYQKKPDWDSAFLLS